MPVLILHAGTHKTGTTSIQASLHEHRSELARAGLVYPSGFRKTDGGLAKTHNWIAQSFSGESPVPVGMAVSMLEDARKKNRDDCVYFISAEDFSSCCDGHKLWKALGNTQFRALQDIYLANLRNALSSFQVRPVLVFRRVDEFAQSLYQTLVGSGHTAMPFEEFLEAGEPLFDYGGQIAAFERAFGDVEVLPFAELQGDQLTSRLLERLGVPFQVPAARERKNTSTDARLTFWQSVAHASGDHSSRKKFAQSSEARSLFADFGSATFWTGRIDPDAFHNRHTKGFPKGFFPARRARKQVEARLDPQTIGLVSERYQRWHKRSDSGWNRIMGRIRRPA